VRLLFLAIGLTSFAIGINSRAFAETQGGGGQGNAQAYPSTKGCSPSLPPMTKRECDNWGGKATPAQIKTWENVKCEDKTIDEAEHTCDTGMITSAKRGVVKNTEIAENCCYRIHQSEKALRWAKENSNAFYGSP
jgi:hypothetical protein